MEQPQQIAQIQKQVQQGRYLLTSHAEQERESDKITIQELEEALLSHTIEIIEGYPEDIRGRSCFWDSPRVGVHCMSFVDWEQRRLSLLQCIVLTPHSG